MGLRVCSMFLVVRYRVSSSGIPPLLFTVKKGCCGDTWEETRRCFFSAGVSSRSCLAKHSRSTFAMPRTFLLDCLDRRSPFFFYLDEYKGPDTCLRHTLISISEHFLLLVTAAAAAL